MPYLTLLCSLLMGPHTFEYPLPQKRRSAGVVFDSPQPVSPGGTPLQGRLSPTNLFTPGMPPQQMPQASNRNRSTLSTPQSSNRPTSPPLAMLLKTTGKPTDLEVDSMC